MQYDKLLVIGNGFDLALGLKTSYIDFMEWLMNEHCMDGTDLYEFLSRKLKVKRWIDIENHCCPINSINYKNVSLDHCVSVVESYFVIPSPLKR